jgi:hypothetical protein
MPWRHGPRFLTRPSLVILLDPHSLLPILLPLLSYTNLGIRVGAVKLRQIGAGLLKAKLYAH